jgi:hypothetical protein
MFTLMFYHLNFEKVLIDCYHAAIGGIVIFLNNNATVHFKANRGGLAVPGTRGFVRVPDCRKDKHYTSMFVGRKGSVNTDKIALTP